MLQLRWGRDLLPRLYNVYVLLGMFLKEKQEKYANILFIFSTLRPSLLWIPPTTCNPGSIETVGNKKLFFQLSQLHASCFQSRWSGGRRGQLYGSLYHAHHTGYHHQGNEDSLPISGLCWDWDQLLHNKDWLLISLMGICMLSDWQKCTISSISKIK